MSLSTYIKYSPWNTNVIASEINNIYEQKFLLDSGSNSNIYVELRDIAMLHSPCVKRPTSWRDKKKIQAIPKA